MQDLYVFSRRAGIAKDRKIIYTCNKFSITRASFFDPRTGNRHCTYMLAKVDQDGAPLDTQGHLLSANNLIELNKKLTELIASGEICEVTDEKEYRAAVQRYEDLRNSRPFFPAL